MGFGQWIFTLIFSVAGQIWCQPGGDLRDIWECDHRLQWYSHVQRHLRSVRLYIYTCTYLMGTLSWVDKAETYQFVLQSNFNTVHNLSLKFSNICLRARPEVVHFWISELFAVLHWKFTKGLLDFGKISEYFCTVKSPGNIQLSILNINSDIFCPGGVCTVLCGTEPL